MSTSRYTKDHEYIRVEADVAIVGITDYAQSQLGDVVFVELPVVGRKVAKGAEAAVVESVKAASGVNAPASGEVVEINHAIEETPALVNEDPHGNGWFMKLKLSDSAELDVLMDEAAYQAFIRTLD
jgi:glycine cleavage system H protein